MAAYTWFSKDELERMSKVSDKELNEVFQEVREVMPNIYISERVSTYKPFLRKEISKTTYSIYHLTADILSDKECLEVRYLALNTTSEPLVFNYLCGLLNGFNMRLKVTQAMN